MADSAEWQLVEEVDWADGGGTFDLRRVIERHPELIDLDDDWFRIDNVCGVEGHNVRRVLVRTTPPPPRPPRVLP